MNALVTRLRGSAKPAALHLAISASIALLAMALIFFAWYPGDLATAQGVSRLVLIMIAVDVVIGPLITLIVYVPGKKHLQLDLMVIAAVQTVALLYGLQAIHGGRPAYVVFNVDRFDVVAVKDLVQDSLTRTPEGLALNPMQPRWVAARLPADPSRRSDILFSAVQGGADLPQLPEYFVPLEAERAAMLQRLRPLRELQALNGLDDVAWRALLDDFGRDEPALGYLPMVANAKDGAVILDAQTGEVLGVRLLTPSFGSPAKPVSPSAPSGLPPRSPSGGGG